MTNLLSYIVKWCYGFVNQGHRQFCPVFSRKKLFAEGIEFLPGGENVKAWEH